MKQLINTVLLLCLFTSTFAQKKETTIVQVSDTQFGFWNDDNIDYEVGTYSQCIEQLNKLKPDAVVLTGDLINHTWVEKQWTALEEITGKLDKKIPVYYIPGNHDVNLHKGKHDMTEYLKHMDYSRFAVRIKNTCLIGLDSNPIKDCYGSEEENEQFHWLEKMLKKNKNKRILIFTHHPFFLEDINEEEGYFQLSKEARKKYFDLFEKYNVAGVFSGHLHQNRIATYKNQIPVITTSAIGVQLGKDKSGYRIIKVDKNKITHEYKNVEE